MVKRLAIIVGVLTICSQILLATGERIITPTDYPNAQYLFNMKKTGLETTLPVIWDCVSGSTLPFRGSGSGFPAWTLLDGDTVLALIQPTPAIHEAWIYSYRISGSSEQAQNVQVYRVDGSQSFTRIQELSIEGTTFPTYNGTTLWGLHPMEGFAGEQPEWKLEEQKCEGLMYYNASKEFRMTIVNYSMYDPSGIGSTNTETNAKIWLTPTLHKTYFFANSVDIENLKMTFSIYDEFGVIASSQVDIAPSSNWKHLVQEVALIYYNGYSLGSGDLYYRGDFGFVGAMDDTEINTFIALRTGGTPPSSTSGTVLRGLTGQGFKAQ